MNEPVNPRLHNSGIDCISSDKKLVAFLSTAEFRCSHLDEVGQNDHRTKNLQLRTWRYVVGKPIFIKEAQPEEQRGQKRP